MVQSAQILQLLILICYVARHTVQVDDSEVILAHSLFGDVYVVHVQIRQTYIQCMNPANECTHTGDDLLLLRSLQNIPLLTDEIAQARGLQLFGDNERFSLDAPCLLLAIADGPVRFDAVVNEEPGAFPFVPALRAGFADVSPGKNNVLEVRARETLNEKRLLPRIRPQAELDDVAPAVTAYLIGGQTLEEIIKRRDAKFGEIAGP